MNDDRLKLKLKGITTCMFDVDGVLTYGNIFINEAGEIHRSGFAKDGYALQLAVKAGINIVILTGTTHQGIKLRFENLGIKHILLGSANKLDTFNEFITAQNLDPKTILYMADDIPDIDVFNGVGFKACPSDAAIEIINIADYVSPFKGGRGCVCDILERILKIQGKWMAGEAHVW